MPALSYSLLAPASFSSCLLWLNPPCNSSIFDSDDDGGDYDGSGDDGGVIDGGGGVVMTESSLQLVHLQQGRQVNQTLPKTLHL